jgi:predicted RNA-binding Zn ribbon-like protein
MPDRRVSPDLRFDAGAGWLDLLATVGSAYGSDPVERLRGPEQLARFLDHHGLRPPVELTPADVADATALRAALRPLALAAVGGTRVDPAVLAALQPWLDRDRPLRAVLRDGRPAVEPPGTVDAALGRLARQAAEHLAGPERAHLGACAADNCRMVFLDPAGRRRWCAPERCGVRSRVRAHRERARHDPGPATTR